MGFEIDLCQWATWLLGYTFEVSKNKVMIFPESQREINKYFNLKRRIDAIYLSLAAAGVILLVFFGL